MAGYIEAKDLEGFRNEIVDKFMYLCDYNDFNELSLVKIVETIDEVYDKYCDKPTADVVEVKHGEWESFEIPHMMRCSECGVGDLDIHRTKFDYCPHCGAKMDGGVNDGNCKEM